MKNISIYIVLIASIFFFSCSEENTAVEKSTSLPPSAGGVGDVLLVVDTNHLNAEIGDALEDMFLAPYPGLPQAEMNYKMNRIHFPSFGSLFKRAKTIIFAIPFNDGISKGYMQRMIGDDVVKSIKKNKKPFLMKYDVFATNQQIIFVFGEDNKELSDNITNNKLQISALIDRKENERLVKKLYNVGERKAMAKKLKDDLGFDIRVPKDYKLVKGTEKCTWLRLAKEETDYNIMISSRPYTSKTQFDSSYISDWRIELASNVDSGDSTSIKITQDVYPIEDRVFAEPYKVESRGLWKLKNNTMGGPFVSEVKLSEDGKKIYYIEGFIVAPGKKKRTLVREIEAILSTFKG